VISCRSRPTADRRSADHGIRPDPAKRTPIMGRSGAALLGAPQRRLRRHRAAKRRLRSDHRMGSGGVAAPILAQSPEIGSDQAVRTGADAAMAAFGATDLTSWRRKDLFASSPGSACTGGTVRIMRRNQPFAGHRSNKDDSKGGGGGRRHGGYVPVCVRFENVGCAMGTTVPEVMRSHFFDGRGLLHLITGRSGAGKTTFEADVSAEPPFTGMVTLFGSDLATAKRSDMPGLRRPHRRGVSGFGGGDNLSALTLVALPLSIGGPSRSPITTMT